MGNSILTVKATEKGTGKVESITITNDKGRLSKADIERMVEEAEKFSEQDKAVKEKLEAKHQLENYIHQMRNTIEDKEKLKDKLDAADKKTIEDALKTEQDWIAANEEAEKDDMEEHFKGLQKICDPIVSKVYQKQGGQSGGAAGGDGKDD